MARLLKTAALADAAFLGLSLPLALPANTQAATLNVCTGSETASYTPPIQVTPTVTTGIASDSGPLTVTIGFY
ncbi:hypothetical protein [Streptomyces vietnamensis]|uniref:hypothetical protein n=1 Tax=Streptomyces vietnamensis TaxID=362257 RepID=UPI0034339BA5